MLRADGADQRQFHAAVSAMEDIDLKALVISQLFMGSKTENRTVFALGSYLLNWIYRSYAEGHNDVIAIFTDAIQTILYHRRTCTAFSSTSTSAKRYRAISGGEACCRRGHWRR